MVVQVDQEEEELEVDVGVEEEEVDVEEDAVVVDAVVDLLVVHQTLKKKFLLPIENRLRRKLKLQLNCKQCNVENI